MTPLRIRHIKAMEIKKGKKQAKPQVQKQAQQKARQNRKKKVG